MATNSQILDMLSTLEGVYGQKLEPDQFKGYYWALEEFDGDLLEPVGKDAVRFCKWFPKPAELREIAERKQIQQDRGDEPRRVYWRITSLHNAILAGRVTDSKSIAAVDQYLDMDNIPEVNTAFEFEELVFDAAIS